MTSQNFIFDKLANGSGSRVGASTAHTPVCLDKKLRSYLNSTRERSNRARNERTQRRFVQNQSDMDNQFQQGDPFAINRELGLPMPDTSSHLSPREAYKKSLNAKKRREAHLREQERLLKKITKKKEKQNKKDSIPDVSFQNLRFLQQVRASFDDVDSLDGIMSTETEEPRIDSGTILPTIEGSIVPWREPYPALDMVSVDANSGSTQTIEYTLMWVNTTVAPWNGQMYGNVFSRSIYDVAMPPLSDYLDPSIESNQIVHSYRTNRVFNESTRVTWEMLNEIRARTRVHVPKDETLSGARARLHKILRSFRLHRLPQHCLKYLRDRRIRNESAKSFAASKWRRTVENDPKSQSKKFQQLLLKNRKKTDEILRLRAELKEQRVFKAIEAEKRVVKDEARPPTEMSCVYDHQFMMIVNINESHFGVATTFQAMKNAGNFNGIKTGMELVRNVAYCMVAQKLGLTLIQVRNEVLSDPRIRATYEEIIKKDFVFLPGVRFRAFPGVIDKIANTSTNLVDELIIDVPDGPSMMAQVTCNVAKFAALFAQLSIARSWEEVLLHIASAIIQNTTPANLDWVFGQSKSVQSLETTVKEFLDHRLKTSGVYIPSEKEVEPIPEHVKIERVIQDLKKREAALEDKLGDAHSKMTRDSTLIEKLEKERDELKRKMRDNIRKRVETIRAVKSKMAEVKRRENAVKREEKLLNDKLSDETILFEEREEPVVDTESTDPRWMENIEDWDYPQTLETPSPVKSKKFKSLFSCNSDVEPVVKDESFEPSSNPFALLRTGFDNARTFIRGGIGLEEKIAETPLLQLIDEVVCLMVFFTQAAPTKQSRYAKENPGEVIPDSKIYRDLIYRAFMIHKTDSISLISRISTVIDLALMITATLWDGASYAVLLNPLDINNRLAHLSAYKNSYAAGNMDLLHAHDKSHMNSKQYETEVSKLVKDITTMLENRMVKPAAVATFTKYLSMTKELEMVVKIQEIATKHKPLPYMIGMYGKPGVGKSLCTEIAFSVIAMAYEFEVTNQAVWNWFPDPNGWDTNATSAKSLILVTEHDNVNTEENDDQIFFNLARMCDTVPACYAKPDLETKGLAYNHLKGGVFCCNQKDFGITKCRDPSATVRRCDFVEVTVKPEYGKKSPGGEHFVPDPEKCPYIWSEQLQDYHPDPRCYEIQPYIFVVHETDGDNSGKSRSTSIKSIGPKLSIPEWRKFMLTRIRERLRESGKFIAGLDCVRRQPICIQCANPEESCMCSVFTPNRTTVKMEVEYRSLYDRFCCAVDSISGFCRHDKTVSKSLDKAITTIVAENTNLKVSETLVDENDEYYYGESDPFTYSFYSQWVPLRFAVWPVYFLTKLAKRFTAGAVSSLLHSMFNIYTLAIVPLMFWSIPPLAVAVFLFMLICMLSIERIARAASDRIMGKNLEKGELTPYWNTSYRDLLKITAVLAGLGFGMYALTTRIGDKAKEVDSHEEAWYFDHRKKEEPPSLIEADDQSAVTELSGDDLHDEAMKVVTVKDLRQKLSEPDEWLVREPLTRVSAIPSVLKTMTLAHVRDAIKANTGLLSSRSLFSNKVIGGCKIVFMTSNCILLPVHRDEVQAGQSYSVILPGTGNISEVSIVKLYRIQVLGKETDMCFALLSTRYPVRNIDKLLDHDYVEKLAGSQHNPSVGECLLDASTLHRVFPTYTEIQTETRTFMGFNCILETPTQSGDCGSPLICAEAPHLVIGFHVSRVNDDESNCSIVPRSEWLNFLKSLTSNQADSVTFKNVFLDNKIPSCPSLPMDDPGPRVCTRFLRNTGPECTSTPPSVFVIGHDKKSRSASKSAITRTPMSTYLEVAGIERFHDAPPLNANRAASTVLQYGARGSLPRGHGLNEAIINHYVSQVVRGFSEFSIKPRPLDLSEAFSGVFRNKFAKPMSLNKACGGGRPGKKRSRVNKSFKAEEEEYYLLDPRVKVVESPLEMFSLDQRSQASADTYMAVVDNHEPVPTCKPELLEEINQIFRAWENGETCNTLVQGALKDDPALLTKIESGAAWGRLVTSQSMAHHICQTMLFGDVISYLRALPFVSGCYEGVSYRSQDWHEIADWHLSLGDADKSTLIDADTKKMDLSMNNQDLVATTETLARIVESLSGDYEHSKLMRRCGYEMSVPILNLCGEWVVMYMNTSGNKLTITYNNISGVQLRTREAYVAYKLLTREGDSPELNSVDFEHLLDRVNSLSEDECSVLLEDFEDNVRPGSVGDDSLITSVCDFDMEFITLYFQAKGVTVTGSDKGETIQGHLQLRDLSCCQRGFRYCEVLGRIVGPLSLKSLSRSLHMTAPSTEKPSIVEAQTVTTVLEELALHGREVFERWRGMITLAALESGRWHIHQKSLQHDFDFYINLLKKRHPTSLSSEELGKTLGRFYYGLNVVDGLVDQPKARATFQDDRLLFEELEDIYEEHHRGILSFDTAPYAGTVVVNQSITNETIENLEIVTPSSTTDATVVAASQSAESKIVTTNDSPVTFTHRPVRLKTYSWSVNSSLNFSFDPWSLLLQNPSIRNKCEFFRFMRAKLVLDISIDGTVFHSGLVWFVYTPLNVYDEISQYDPGNIADLVELSQKPRVTISPRNSQGGKMTLPFIFPRDFVDMTTDDVAKLGVVTVRSIVPLKMVNAGTLACSITVLAHFEDLELVMPTIHPIATLKIVDQSSWIDRSAYAGNMADLTQTPPSVSTDPSVMWSGDAPTSIVEIGKRECFIGSFSWNTDRGIDSVVASFRCSPFHGMITGSGATAEYHVTPSCWVGLPFTYWSGTCVYRFEIICSQHHRGKLMFTWDPIYTVISGEYNKNYSVVVDIGEKVDHTAKIGWGQDLPFLPTITGMSQIANQNTGLYTTTEPFANGVLTMTVFSPLILPSILTNEEVTINVYQRMDDDFKVSLIRRPLAASLTQKNNPDTNDDQTSSLTTGFVSPPVINPSTATATVLQICEEPMPLLYVPNAPYPDASRVNATYVGPLSDADMVLVTLPVTASYSLASKTPPAIDRPAVVTFRGFVEGGSTITVIPQGGPPVPGNRTKTAQLTGISDLEDVILNYEDSNKFFGSFSMSSTTRVQATRIGYFLPRWGRVTLRNVPVLPNIIDLTPFVNWYSYTLSGGRPILGPLLAAQSPVDRTEVAFKIRLNPSVRLISNLVVSYLSGGSEPSPISCYSRQVVYVLPHSGAGERRHFVYDGEPDAIFIVPTGATIGILQLSYLQLDQTAVRSAVKSQPVLVTNQSAWTPDDGTSMIMHGPRCINDHHHQFFQEIETDILTVLKRFMPSKYANTNPSVYSGWFVFKVTHFPFTYRTSINGNVFATEQHVGHLLDYFARAYITIRGSTTVSVRMLVRASGSAVGFLQYQRTDNTQISNAEAATNRHMASYPGVEFHNIRLTNSAELNSAWFSRERFGFARSTDIANHHQQALRIDVGYSADGRLAILHKVGDDFSLGHFLSTPVLRAYL